MTTKKLVLSAVFLSAVSILIGYQMNEVIKSDVLVDVDREFQNLETELARTKQDKTKIEGELSSLRTQLDSLQDAVSRSEDVLQTTSTTPKKTEDDQSEQGAIRSLGSERMRSLQADLAKKVYGDLFVMLNLDDQQIDAFIGLFVDSWEEAIALLRSVDLGDGVPPQLNAIEIQREQNIRELLRGDFHTYNEYSETLDARQILGRFASSLAEPLDDYIKAQLIRIITRENEAVGLSDMENVVIPFGSTIFTMPGMDGETHLSIQKKRLEATKIRDEGVIDVARSYLTNEQHESFVEILGKARAREELFIQMMEQ